MKDEERGPSWSVSISLHTVNRGQREKSHVLGIYFLEQDIRALACQLISRHIAYLVHPALDSLLRPVSAIGSAFLHPVLPCHFFM